MSNSPLVSYVKLSPNKNSPRNHVIDTITIHCVVGQCSVETIGEIFYPVERQGSCNYGIGPDGRIGMYVEEKDRSWCSSSAYNDHRAITIEVASDKEDPYAVTDEAYNALIDLVTDICQRNNIKKLVWSTNKYDRINHRNGCNMTVHRDYSNRQCPGKYLYDRHGDIADQVNKRLGSYETTRDPQVGDIIKLKNGTTYYNGRKIPSWIFNYQLYYRGKNSNGIIFSVFKDGSITGVVKPENVIFVKED